MADTFTLEIVSPTEILFSGEVETVTAPAVKGEVGVLTGHTEYLTILSPGEIKYTAGGSVVSMVVGSGYSEVGPKKTSVLVESATLTSDIDLKKVEAELKEASAALDGMLEDDPAYRETLERRDLANAMIEAAEKKKGR
jgi:F-type H+-transporting ATPase subunit epsilon